MANTMPPDFLQQLLSGGGPPPEGVPPGGPPPVQAAAVSPADQGAPPMPEPLPENSGLPPDVGAETAPRPGPGDIAVDPQTGDDGRPTADEVNYTWGQCCGTCKFFMHPESCQEVNGHIRADGVCDLHEEVAGLPFDPTMGDIL